MEQNKVLKNGQKPLIIHYDLHYADEGLLLLGAVWARYTEIAVANNDGIQFRAQARHFICKPRFREGQVL